MASKPPPFFVPVGIGLILMKINKLTDQLSSGARADFVELGMLFFGLGPPSR